MTTDVAPTATPGTGRLDLSADLPSGTTLLEASAGTGKTHTIASLVVLSVARGTPLHSILLITFTRKAARELRDRVRSRIRETLEVLQADGPAEDDPVLQALFSTGRPISIARLRAALSDFDAATIATIHEFAGSMLARLGLLSARCPDAALLADHSALIEAVTDDLFLSRYRDATATPPFTREAAGRIVRAAVGNRTAALVPDPAENPIAAERVEFAARARQEFERRMRAGDHYMYDDLIGQLVTALLDPVNGEATAARLRDTYRLVMVDEFQDTDPGQWQILRTAFHHHSDLYLIGDPKQAIYAFRGGDVQTYLAAAREADRRLTLSTNWRSDQPVVRGISSILGGTALGDPDITVGPVVAQHQGTRLLDPVGTPAPGVSLRVVRKQYEYVWSQRDRIRDDVVAVVSRLLTDGTTLDDGHGPRPVLPSDIAVLVRYNKAAEQVADRLAAHGITSVVNGADSVLRSPAASHWHELLTTLIDPQSAAVHRLALGPFVGWSLEDLIRADEDAVAGLFIRVRSWARLWERHGIAAVLEAALSEGHLAASSIGRTGSERQITDLRHVGQLLHRAETGQHLAPRELVGWLDRQAAAARSGDDEQALRLETETEAVQVLTIHSAKGLEFPIVLLPDVSDQKPRSRRRSDIPAAFTVHDRAGDRLVDVGGEHEASTAARHGIALEEEAGEDLRLLYVAMTRASSQVVAWWAPQGRYAPESPLHRALFGAREADGSLPAQVPVTGAAEPPTLAGVTVSYVDADPVPIEPLERPVPDCPVRLRRLDRPIDTDWRRTSYSGLTAAQHAEPHGVPAEDPGAGDEPSVDLATATTPGTDLGTSLWSDLPGGARFGTLVHAALEEWSPTGPALAGIVTDLASRTPVDDLDPGLLTTALDAAIRTPLGSDLADLSLADIPARDRLNELDFELPLGGGDHPGRSGAVADIADCLDRHLAPSDPLAAYAAQLREPELGDQVLRGFLTGSIDAVLRVPGPDPRFVVVDYKTNRLGPPAGEAPLPLAAYTPDRLAEAMMAAHYPLQALLYSVALHRFLAWRMPGYRPERHLGGIRYLFVRGMAGPRTPVVGGSPCGVFAWDPPAAMITELADLVTDGGDQK